MKESRMKKFAVIALSLLAILAVGISIAAAQESVNDVVPGANFIDENGDGQCDLYGTDQAGNGGAGYGQGYGSRGNSAAAENFVDEDGDGQCDLMGSGAVGQGQGFGPQGGNGACGDDFVDEDGDGICDLAGIGQAGSGQGSGSQGQGGNGYRGGAGNGFSNGRGRDGSQGYGMGQGARGAGAAQ